MQRITQRDLEGLCDRLNKLTGSPETEWTRTNNTTTANIGNYHIDYSVGGVCLYRMENTGGAVSCPLVDYHTPKKELYNRIQAYIYGIIESK